jgi:Type VI secretion system (T6SS), amidase immunity protein
LEPSVKLQLYCVLLLALAGCATTISARSRELDATRTAAGSRTYAQNYKDMMLAECVAMAYRAEPAAMSDAQNTASALDAWSQYDVEESTGKSDEIILRFLQREYHAKSDAGARLDLLKCIDMYHSDELDAQVRQYVPNPARTYYQDQGH